MIDLHMHTNYSDGTDSLIELLKKAEEKNLEIISITDHDKVDAYFELENLNVKDYYSGKIIVGSELKAYYKGITIDILAYDIDYNKMDKWLKKIYVGRSFVEVQSKQLKFYYDICTNLGIKMNTYEEVSKHIDITWAVITVIDEIKSHPENEKIVPDLYLNDRTNFRMNYCKNKESEFYYDLKDSYPSLEEVIDGIHICNGKAFLAHLFQYRNIKDKKNYLDEIIGDYKIEGLETYYSNFNEKQTLFMEDYCKDNNLLMSGGSDYHGLNKANISLGIGRGNLSISKDILNNWKK